MAGVRRHVERSRLHGRALHHDPRWALPPPADGISRRPGDVEQVVNYVRAMNHGLARLVSYPCRCTSSGMMSLLGTTFAGANQIVQRLVEIGILREFTGQARHRRFRYDAYVRLFDEEA